MREFSSHSVIISALICVSTWVVSSKAALAQDSSVLWLRADKGVNVNNSVPADNTRLVTWFNQQNASFNGEAPTHHAGESSGAMASPLPTMPFYRYGLDHHINFNPVILFDDSGEGNAIEITTPTTLDQTIFAVFKSPGTGRSQYQVGLVYGGDVSDPTGDEPSHRSDMSFGIGQGSKLSFGGGFQGDYFTEGDFKLFDIPSIGVLQRKVNGTSNVDFNIFANGSPDELDQRVTNTGSGHPLMNRVRIGRHYSGGGKLSGYVAEIMVYDSVLDATSRNIVESYLAIKYGVTLNSTQDTLGSSYGNTGYDYLNSDGNVLWDASLNTLFKYNIAGLGRDDTMSLDQRISQSVNYGSVVKMSTDNDLSSFNLNAARDDIANDKAFLMWAADKSSVDRTSGALIPLLPVSSGNPKGIKSRVDRNWMVQLSNIDSTSLEQVGIEFDLNQLSGFGALAQDQVLMMIDSDQDADYTTGNVEIIEPTSFIDNRAVFHDVALTHGAVFSIAIKLTDVQIDTPVMATFSNQFSYPVSGVCTLNAGDVQVTIDDAAPLTKTVSCVANTDPNSSFTGKWSAQMNVSPVASGTGTVIINATQNAQQALPKVADKESNTPPSIDLNGPSQNGENYTASFEEGSLGVAITASDVTVTDAQDTMMASAKITLQNTQAGDDFILPNNINGIVFNKSKNAQGNWEVTLTGVASLADYQAALAGIDFVSVSQKPSTVTRAIEVVVNDGQLNSNIASTQISVADVDDLSAQDDTFTLNENSFISANVADNDSTTSGATLSYSVAENNNVEHGTLVLSADGSYVYTPNKDFVGQDSFKYVVVDQITGEELIQTVTIDVLPVNRPPLASDDRVQIN
ncbi:MAG: cadherin-like domain-containing protein, partial [Psychrobium sp.]